MVSGNRVVDGEWTPAGYQQLTGMTTAQQLTVPTNAALVLLQAETEAVRWRDDGTAPTASVGMLLAAGETLPYNGDLRALRFIEVVTGAKLNVTYFK